MLVLEVTDLEDKQGFRHGRRKWMLSMILWRWDRTRQAWDNIASGQAPYAGVSLRHVGAGILGHDLWRDAEGDAAAADRIYSYLRAELSKLRCPAIVADLILHALLAQLVTERESVESLSARNGFLSEMRNELVKLLSDLTDVPRKPAARVVELPTPKPATNVSKPTPKLARAKKKK